jgi:hypothetical protein
VIPLPKDRLNISTGKYGNVNYTSSSFTANRNKKRFMQKLHTIKCVTVHKQQRITDLMQCYTMNRDALYTVCTDLYVG